MEADNRQFDGKLFLKDVNRKLNDRLAEIQKDLNQGLKEIENMEHLVKEILSISKLEMNTMSHTELLSLSNILKRVYKHLIPLANEKHIRIQKML